MSGTTVQRTADHSNRLWSLALCLLIGASAVGVWQLWTMLVDPGGMAPTPTGTWKRLVEILSGAFTVEGPNSVGIAFHAAASLQRVLAGFGAAVLLAVPLGLVLGIRPTLAAALDPYIQVLRPVSPLAWLPLGLAVLRDSEATAVFVIFMASLWLVLINTIDGVHRIDPLHLDLARTLEATWWQRTTRVVLPATLPAVLTGLRTALSTAWLVIVAAEMIVGSRGIGHFVWTEWNAMNTDSIVVAILLIGVIGLLLDRGILAAGRLLPGARGRGSPQKGTRRVTPARVRSTV